MALALVDGLTFSYPDAPPALEDVSLQVEPGEVVLLLGASGSGKSTLLRALAGLVPWFHGGRFAGRVEVAGLDTRSARPADLAGSVATVFQDPEDQVVLAGVAAEVAFGLENLGVAPAAILPRAHAALAAVGIEALAERPTTELSGGELQRVCLASALALDPELLLLDEPTSQLDPAAAQAFLERALGGRAAVVLSEQRPATALRYADRVVFLERGRILLDASRDDALEWLAAERPAWTEPSNTLSLAETCRSETMLVSSIHGDVQGNRVVPHEPSNTLSLDRKGPRETVCRVERVRFAYDGRPVLDGASLELRRGEVVALTGPNGSGKTTLAKLAAGLLEPQAGHVERAGRAAFLLQDPGRYLVRERALDEVALGHGRERARHVLAEVGLDGVETRHPRDLSSGERERLALATVLVTDPDLLVLDEPTRGVDPERKAELAALLRAQAHRRATLVVTHDRLFAAAVADREVSLGETREPVLA
ncbi:MAG TPA: ATP-binding cassette domain-containing protein [Gaiellaceae bacterium]|nr:ATP-binding cassette domain-containing protein [Gaiellaceae bacterium]